MAGPTNGTLSFYECKLSDGEVRGHSIGGGDSCTLPFVIGFIRTLCTQKQSGCTNILLPPTLALAVSHLVQFSLPNIPNICILKQECIQVGCVPPAH